jgi:tetratricopeptide (TPR) repeat protein
MTRFLKGCTILGAVLVVTALAVACSDSASEKALWLQEQAMLCEERGDYLCAEEKYGAILEDRPNDVLLLQRRGRLRALRGQYALAASDVDRIADSAGENAWVNLTRAVNTANPAPDMTPYNEAVAETGGHPVAHFYRGIQRGTVLRDLGGANEDFAAAYAKWPEYTPALLYQALAARETGQVDLALAQFGQAIAADKQREEQQKFPLFGLKFGGSFQPYFERGRLLIGSGRMDYGCRDILAAVRRGYIGDPLGCRVQLESIASGQVGL